ncbi:MAG: TonB-dependent receptor, partial [Bacteroidota bacterium]
IWIPSSRHIRPQISDQVSIGYFRNFFENKLETSVELYYKDLRNQIDFKNGAELILNPTIETEILTGDGESYGSEFLVRKKTGKLTGWISYTLSKTTRQIDGINGGRAYAANTDRRHDVAVASTFQLTPRVNFGAQWVYQSGRAVTYPIGGYELECNFIPLYGDRNADRFPDYHRLDVSVTIDGKKREDETPEGEKKKRKLESSWNISCYNAYGRRNVFAIDFREEMAEGSTDHPCDPSNQTVRQAYKIYLFRWVPSVTWNFRF